MEIACPTRDAQVKSSRKIQFVFQLRWKVQVLSRYFKFSQNIFRVETYSLPCLHISELLYFV